MARSAWAAVSVVVVGASVVSALLGPAGDEFRINDLQSNLTLLRPGGCSRPDGTYAVTWTGYEGGGGDYGVRARRVARNGATIGTEFRVNTYTLGFQGYGRLCCTPDGGFIVTWTSQQDGSDDGIYAQRYDFNATAVGDEFQVNAYTTGPQAYPSIACHTGGGYGIAWLNAFGDGSGTGVSARLFASTGSPIGTDFVVNAYTTGNQDTVSVGALDDGFVLAWASTLQDGDGVGVFGRRVDTSGAFLGSEFRVNAYTSDSQFNPALTVAPDNSFYVTWTDDATTDIMVRHFDSSGAPLGTEFRVNTYTSGLQVLSSISGDRTGGFVVSWDDVTGADGDGPGVFGQRFDTAGAALGTEFRVNTYTTGTQGYGGPGVAVDPDGDFLVVWSGQTVAGTTGLDIVGRIFRDPCGDGTVDAGEACDDGSRLPGDCCDPTCQPETRGDPCTGAGTGCFACDGAGACADGAVACPACRRCEASTGCVVGPRSDCRRPTKPRRALLNVANQGNDRKDVFLFSWQKGAATDLAGFGNPVTTDDVDVCLFDRAGGVDRLVYNATAPAGGQCKGKACWKARGAKGFRYRDREATPDGLTAIDLTTGAAGKASVVVNGKGANLGLPALGLTPPVTAEVDVGDQCFAATFTAPRPNSATKLKGKGN